MQGVGTYGRREFVKKRILPLIILLSFIILDQVLKTVCKNLYENHGWLQTRVIDGFFYFRYTMNTGASYGFLANKPWAQTFFICLTSVLLPLFAVYYAYATKRNYTFLKYALIFVMAGTIGNFIDRIAYGGVVDFLNLVINGNNVFGIFNVADVYLTVGVIMLLVYYLFVDENALLRFKKNGKKEV